MIILSDFRMSNLSYPCRYKLPGARVLPGPDQKLRIHELFSQPNHPRDRVRTVFKLVCHVADLVLCTVWVICVCCYHPLDHGLFVWRVLFCCRSCILVCFVCVVCFGLPLCLSCSAWFECLMFVLCSSVYVSKVCCWSWKIHVIQCWC